MFDYNSSDTKESITIDTNGLGSVVLQLHGTGKVLHLTSCQARELARKMEQKATDADFQNTAL